MNSENWKMLARDGLPLAGTTWTPTAPPRAAILLIHGLGEHHGRYAHVAAAAAERGLAVLAFDLRGHGQSQGKRGHTPTYAQLLDDVDAGLARLRTTFPGVPHFLYGHSLGGSLVINYLLRQHPAVTGAVVTSPGLATAFTPPAAKLRLARLLDHVLPALTMGNEIDPAGIARDPEVVRAYLADPLVHDRLSVRLGMAILDSGQYARDHAAELTTPLLVMVSPDDPITSAPAAAAFCVAAGEVCALREWPGLFHELHNEAEQAAVIAALLDWIEARL
jgi:alpha-beta hydrolase superfamily lysophospholipase